MGKWLEPCAMCEELRDLDEMVQYREHDRVTGKPSNIVYWMDKTCAAWCEKYGKEFVAEKVHNL